jgi:hypothetical protein
MNRETVIRLHINNVGQILDMHYGGVLILTTMEYSHR